MAAIPVSMRMAIADHFERAFVISSFAPPDLKSSAGDDQGPEICPGAI